MMYIFKQLGIGGEVRWHQDATFFDSTPISVTTFWFALEDATVDNGCLWVAPGAHRGPLRERFLCDGDRITMEKLDRAPWPDDASAVPLEAKAGSLVCFHGLLPCYSAPNRSAVSRHAFTLHVMDARTAYSDSPRTEAATIFLQEKHAPLRMPTPSTWQSGASGRRPPMQCNCIKTTQAPEFN